MGAPLRVGNQGVDGVPFLVGAVKDLDPVDGEDGLTADDALLVGFLLWWW